MRRRKHIPSKHGLDIFYKASCLSSAAGRENIQLYRKTGGLFPINSLVLNRLLPLAIDVFQVIEQEPNKIRPLGPYATGRRTSHERHAFL